MTGLQSIVRNLEASFDVQAYLFGSRAQLACTVRDDTRDDWVFECPVCTRPKLYVSVVDKGDPPRPAGTWICFYCSESGSPISLIQRLEGCSFFTALALLRSFSRYVERETDLRGAVERALQKLDAGPAEEDVAIEHCEMPVEFISIATATRFPVYLRARGIDHQTAIDYGLGFCPSGWYANRLIVPIYCKGALAWYLGRWMAKHPPEGVKKYLNSLHAPSSKTLFGIEKAQRARRVVLVEDVFSAMHLGQGAVALCGTTLSRAQLNLLAELTDAQELVICLDRDASEKSWKLASALSELWSVSVVNLRDARDPDEIPFIEFWDLVKKAPVVGSSAGFAARVRGRLNSL